MNLDPNSSTSKLVPELGDFSPLSLRKNPPDLEKQAIHTFDPECVRKKSNWSKGDNNLKFDDENFNPKLLLENIPDYSPKLSALMSKIAELDRSDKKTHGKLFKHFIFSDLKSGTYGAKMLAAAFIAKGFHLGYGASLKVKGGADGDIQEDDTEKKRSRKRYNKIELLSDSILKKTTNDNFYMMCSVGVYDQPISVVMKKSMLSKFNQRPENVQGNLVRFIILDSGFKEGIDLFDIKYIHIFEPSVVASDQKQVIGRGTRTCGQKGIEFHPTQGWPLHIFIYDLTIQETIRKSLLGAETAMDLYLKAMNLDVRLLTFASDLEKNTIFGSVDYELNENVHNFAVADDESIIRGGGPKLRVLNIPPRIVNTQEIVGLNGRLGFKGMRRFIRDRFSEFAWPPVKMENLCVDFSQTKGVEKVTNFSPQVGQSPEKFAEKKGGSTILNYTPTQDFIRHYFTPNQSVKGMLLSHSVGTGKTCSAIAAATNNFEKAGYTILWVTRATLKNDIWKNMFDQVCNESIRHQIQHSDLKIPEEQNKRMRLLSKAWRIRPMSYKQFSNLVSKQNSYYETLVKINGNEDPLRKTLLIIDEAHKLYGGGDLSSLEKPDMNALRQSLMYSYKYSGQDSCRLLLMTATPITQNPMELIQLVNLCKQEEEQMPVDFSKFSDKYLDNQGVFTERGREIYLDDISGYISYLNREKDARQFSQPRLHYVNVPITRDMDLVHKFDRKIVRNILDSDILELKGKLDEENKKIQGEIAEINVKKFAFMKDDVCGELVRERSSQQLTSKMTKGHPISLESPSQKMCEKIVNKNIREIVQAVKDELNNIRDKIKQVREEIKTKGASKRDTLSGIKGNMVNLEEEYNEYKKTLLYQIKNKCAKKITDKNQFDAHPVVQQYNLAIQQHNNELQELDNQLKSLSENYKKRMKHLRTLLKHDLNESERSVINMVIRDERKTYRVTMKMKKKENVLSKKLITTDISNVEKDRKKKMAKIRKTYKKALSADAKQKKQIMNVEKRLRKTLTYANAEGIQSDMVKGLVNKYQSKIMDELVDASKESLQKTKDKEEQKAEKIRLQELAKRAKILERERARDTKKQEREHIRETKKREKEAATLAKKMEKQSARKTKKNKIE